MDPYCLDLMDPDQAQSANKPDFQPFKIAFVPTDRIGFCYLDLDSYPHCDKKLDPDPHWNQ